MRVCTTSSALCRWVGRLECGGGWGGGGGLVSSWRLLCVGSSPNMTGPSLLTQGDWDEGTTAHNGGTIAAPLVLMGDTCNKIRMRTTRGDHMGWCYTSTITQPRPELSHSIKPAQNQDLCTGISVKCGNDFSVFPADTSSSRHHISHLTNSNVNQTEINLWQRSLNLRLLWLCPAHPSLSAHPHFSISPSCKFLHSAQDAQSINKTLSPPLGACAQEATQEPAGLPSKAASLVAPRNASRFGNRGTGEQGSMKSKWGGGVLGSWIIETAPSCSCAGANQSKIGLQQKEMRSSPKDRRHFTPRIQPNSTLWNTQASRHTHTDTHSLAVLNKIAMT